MTWLGFVALALVFTWHSKVDQRIWGTRLTPGVLLSGGYVAIAGVYALASLVYEMRPISLLTYIVLFLFELFTLASSIGVAFATSWRRDELRLPAPDAGNGVRWALIAWCLFYTALVWRAAESSGGFWSADSKEVLGGGLFGHSHVLLAFLVIWYAVSTRDQAALRYPLLAVGVLVLSLYPVKGWTLFPVLAVAINESLQKRAPRAGMLPIAIAALVGTLVFFGIYISRADVTEVSSEVLGGVLDEIFQHFVFYLTAGFEGLNAVVEGLRLPGGLDVLFAPVTNTLSLATGDPYVNIISDTYIEGLVGHGEGGNVFSMIGSLIGHVGVVAGTALAVLLLSLAYVLFALAMRLRSSAATAGLFYMLAVYSFGWFEYYLWHLTVYEIALLAIAATALRRLWRP